MLFVVGIIASMFLILWDAHVLNCLAHWYLPEFGVAVPELSYAMAFVGVLALRVARPVLGQMPKLGEAPTAEESAYRLFLIVIASFINSLMTLAIGWFIALVWF